jgi:hypothetical protein
MSYVICDKRKGSPKVHVQVCEKKCKGLQECKVYKAHMEKTDKKAA